jgi:hypothetical protein
LLRYFIFSFVYGVHHLRGVHKDLNRGREDASRSEATRQLRDQILPGAPKEKSGYLPDFSFGGVHRRK